MNDEVTGLSSGFSDENSITTLTESGISNNNLPNRIVNFDVSSHAEISSVAPIQRIVSGSYETNGNQVSAQHFGTIITTFTSFTNVIDAHTNAGIDIGHIRWPDGAQSEKIDGLYNLTNADIMDKQGRGLSDILTVANELNIPFSMIIPTVPYLDEPEQGQADLHTFLVRLLGGYFGQLPEDFTLEIGNESFNARGTVTGNRYWDITESLLTTLRETMADPIINPTGVDFNITVQSGNGLFTTNNLLNTVSLENLEIVDAIVSHHLESSINDFGFDDINTVYERWSSFYYENGLGEIEQNFSAWNVGKPVTGFELHEIDISNGIDVSDINVSQLLNNDIGARQASGTISAVSQFIAYGVDTLSVWGNVKHENSYLWHTDLGGLEAVSHGGEALRLMSESLIGTHLLQGSIVNEGTSNEHWTQNNTSTTYNSFTYEDTGKIVLFLVANDIAEIGQDIYIDIQEFGGIAYVWAEIIRTEVPAEYSEFEGTDYQRLFEVPVITRMQIEFNDNSFTYHLEQDYEVVRFIIGRSGAPIDALTELVFPNLGGASLPDNDLYLGTSLDDTIYGSDHADTINGYDGDDFIFGGVSANDLRDVIFAGAGNDSVHGGYGNDNIFGQDGNDTLVGGFGADTLQGQNGNDVIVGSALSDLLFGNAGDDFVNGGFGHDRINGGTGADRFFHLGIFDHGSDWIQDYNTAEGDLLIFGQLGATADQFQVNFAHTATPEGERSGDDAVEEAFVIYRPTGQIMWALVDGGGQGEINIRLNGEVFDLLL